MKKNMLPALALIIFSICFSLYLMANPRDTDKQIAVLFPLQNTLLENINLAIASQTNVIRIGMIDQILIVEEKGIHSRESLYNHGAIAIFNPVILGGCILNATKPTASNQ